MGSIFQFEWEVKLIIAVQDLIRSLPFMKNVFACFTMLGEAETLVVFIAFIYWSIDKKLGIKAAIYMLGAMSTNCMLKNVFKRIRPYAANENIECFKAPDSKYDINDMPKQGFSFPSGHATSTSRLLTVLYHDERDKKLLQIGSFIVAMICISRFALGVHYPTDVLTGTLLGVFPVIILDKVSKKLEKKYCYTLLLAYSCIGVFFCKSNDYYSILGIMIGFMCGDLYDDKYVRFENTNNVLRMIIRTLCGGILFLGLITVLKQPFAKEILEAHSLFAYLYRVFRYALSTFLIIGIYPMLFKYNVFKLKEKDAGQTE